MGLVSRLNWQFGKAIREMDRKLELKMKEVGKVIKKTAKAYVAVDTGALKRSINYRYYRRERKLVIYALGRYAFFQEFGTRFMHAHPFIRPAILASGFHVGTIEVLFPGIRKPRRTIPLFRANPAKMAVNARINANYQKQFQHWRRQPTIAFRGKLARSLTGYKPPIKSRP